MRLEELNFDLPEHLIAQRPAATREAARLLALDRGTGALTHGHIPDLVDLLRPGDLLVVNDTKVLPARLFARRATGGAVEVLLLESAPSAGVGAWRALLGANRPLKAGERLRRTDGRHDLEGEVQILARGTDGLWTVVPHDGDFEAWMASSGTLPLPPYIRRNRGDERDAEDRERYQTVFARHAGAVAAPTAGLHLTHDLLARLATRGVAVAPVTLHVGLGTFQPVKVDDLALHRMHAEPYVVPAETADAVRRTRAAGGRVVAVGTTSVRTLEAAALASPDGLPQAGGASTDLFVLPGFRFRVVDALLTNFHLPRSTLLALVAAFAGLERLRAAYREAVDREYRFFSYGDAMFLHGDTT